MGLVYHKSIMIKEYYTVNELSRLNNMTARNIRKIINSLKEKNELLIFKKDNVWMVHHLLIPKFKRKRTKVKSYNAITIDPVENYSIEEIYERLKQTAILLNDKELEFKITIEPKISDSLNHIHGYFVTGKKRAFINCLKFWFPDSSYHIVNAYDLDGWKAYMTKTGAEIITIQ